MVPSGISHQEIGGEARMQHRRWLLFCRAVAGSKFIYRKNKFNSRGSEAKEMGAVRRTPADSSLSSRGLNAAVRFKISN